MHTYSGNNSKVGLFIDDIQINNNQAQQHRRGRPMYESQYIPFTKKRNYTELHKAAAKDDCNKILELLNKIYINIQETQGFTALHFAVLNGHSKAVELLLKKGASTAYTDDKNRFPLNCGANLDIDLQVFKLLIQKSRKFINHKDGFGWSTLERVANNTNFDSEEKKNKRIEAAKLLASYGAIVNEKIKKDANKIQPGLGEELQQLSLRYQVKQNAKDIFNAANGLAQAGVHLEITHKILDYFNTDNKIETETFKQVKNYSTEFAYKRSGSGFIQEILGKKPKTTHLQTILDKEEQVKHTKNIVAPK
ncbi:MAG: ankyrin repeat domain-containing protein [Alphaproteobacteria bacterium]